MSPFLQASNQLSLPVRTRGTKVTSESSLNLTSPPDNTNVELATIAGHVRVRHLIQHAIHSDIYTAAVLAVAAAVTTAIVLLRLAKTRTRSSLRAYMSIKDQTVITINSSSQTADISGQKKDLKNGRSSKNYTQNNLAACVTFTAGSSGSGCTAKGIRIPLLAVDLTSLLLGQAQGAAGYTLNRLSIPLPTPLNQDGWPALQLRPQDRPRLPQSQSLHHQQHQQQLDPQLRVSRYMPPGRMVASDSSKGMPRKDEPQQPKRQSRGVSISPNLDSDARLLAPPAHLSDDLFSQRLSPTATTVDNAPYRASILLPPKPSSPWSAASVRTDGASSETMEGGDTSWPEALASSSQLEGDVKHRGTSTVADSSTSSIIPPFKRTLQSTSDIPVPTTQTRLSTNSNNATPRQVPSRPTAAPPLLALDTSDAPAVFSFENRRKGYAASIPPELDSGGSSITRLALIHQGDSPFHATTGSESPFESEISSAASGSLSRASSATSPGMINVALDGSYSSISGSPGGWQHKTDESRRNQTDARPIPIPLRKADNSMWSTHDSKTRAAFDTLDIRPIGPSSFPPSSPLLPPPPPGSDNYGLESTLPTHQHGHTDGAEEDVDYEMASDHEHTLQEDDVPSWMRHTRSFGGGVCLACLANGGGFYGENVPLEERRPR